MVFDDQNLNITWAPAGGVVTGAGTIQVARITLKDTATGSFTLMGWDTAFHEDAIILTGDFGLKNRADATGDGFVGADDLVRILTNWGASGAGVTWEMGDVAPYGDGSDPGDDFIGADDYVEVLTYWGTTYTPEPVPEPATLALLLVSGLLALRRKEL